MHPWSRRQPSDASQQLSLSPGLTRRLAEHDPCLLLQHSPLAASVVSVQVALRLHIASSSVFYILTSQRSDTSFPINLKNWLVVTSHIKLNAVFSPLVFTLATYNCWSVTNGKCCLVVVMCPTNEPLHFKPGPEKADHTAWAGARDNK